MPDGIQFIFEGFDKLDRDINTSIEVLRNNLAEPLETIMDEFENYAEEALRTERAPRMGQPWQKLSDATLAMRAARKFYYRRAGSGGAKAGFWTGQMASSVTSVRGRGAIRKLRASGGRGRLRYGSSLQKAVYFHHGTVRGRKRFGFGGQPPRPIIPIPAKMYENDDASNTPAAAIANAVFNSWLGRRVVIFRQSKGAILQGVPGNP